MGAKTHNKHVRFSTKIVGANFCLLDYLIVAWGRVSVKGENGLAKQDFYFAFVCLKPTGCFRACKHIVRFNQKKHFVFYAGGQPF